MSKQPPKDIARSVHQRLLNEAKRTGRPFNELLQYYAMERLLYRLSVYSHSTASAEPRPDGLRGSSVSSRCSCASWRTAGILG